MDAQKYQVEVQSDFLQKLSKVNPVAGLAELVWNSLDADARHVQVSVNDADLGFESVVIRDDGTGFPHSDAPILFRRLGDSWKRQKHVSLRDQRFLHGSEGQGRFKGLAIGRVVAWEVVRTVGPQRFERFTVTVIADKPAEVSVSKAEYLTSARPGVTVTVTELNKGYAALKGAQATQSFCEMFSSYLRSYRDVEIHLPTGKLNPDEVIAATKHLRLDDIVYADHEHSAYLELIAWKVPTERYLHFCDERGLSLSRSHLRIHVPGFDVSAHLKSAAVSMLAQDGLLGLEEMHPALGPAIDRIGTEVKTFHRERLSEDAISIVESWKQEKVYPYIGEPTNSLEKIEREVFNIVAAKVNRHLPDFTGSSKQSKQFQLQLLRQAVEKSPEDLRLILTQVLDLPQVQRKDLADLLETVSLSGIIAAAKLVADRLDFLAGLERLLFDTEEKKNLKERRQLHRLLVSRTWLFGEQFALTVDDQSLDQVLLKHLELGGRNQVELLSPVTKVGGKRGIVDLMFSRRIPGPREDEREHLIVELKAPKVKVGAKELMQIKEYALAVARDERFRDVTARWDFWLLTNEYDEFAAAEARQTGRPRNLIWDKDDPPMRVWLKTWSQLIDENRARLRFMQKELDYDPVQEDALERLKLRHADLFSAVTGAAQELQEPQLLPSEHDEISEASPG
jgi:hypothetical protein